MSFCIRFPISELDAAVDRCMRSKPAHTTKISTRLSTQSSMASFTSTCIEDLDRDLQKFIAEMPNSPVAERSPKLEEDLFDNAFVPHTPIAWTNEDWYDATNGIAKEHRFAWKFAVREARGLTDEELGRGVRPSALELEGPAQPAPRAFKYPTLDEVMDQLETESDCSSCDSYNDSYDSDDSFDSFESGTTRATSVSVSVSPTPLRTISPLPKYPPSSPSPSSSRARHPQDVNRTPSAKKRKAVRQLQNPTPKKLALDISAVLASLSNYPGSLVKEPAVQWVDCPHRGCHHRASAYGDMQRHLQSAKHQAPSVPCPRGCGKMYTRIDAARRHASQKRCKRQLA